MVNANPFCYKIRIYLQLALRKKSPYSRLFWSAFFRIQTEHGKNADQNNLEDFFKEKLQLRRSIKKVFLKVFQDLQESIHAEVSSFLEILLESDSSTSVSLWILRIRTF